MRQASHCSNTYSIHKQTVSSQTFKKSRAHNVVTYLVAFELSPRCFMGQFRTFPLCFHFGKFSFQALDTTPVAFRGGTKLREKQEARLRILQVFRCPLFSPLRPLTPLTFTKTDTSVPLQFLYHQHSISTAVIKAPANVCVVLQTFCIVSETLFGNNIFQVLLHVCAHTKDLVRKHSLLSTKEQCS